MSNILSEQEKALQDLLLYGQSFMLDGRHISLERTMADNITYDEAIMRVAELLNNTPHAPVRLSADIIAEIFHKTNGEVYIDLRAERYEQKKVM